MTWTKPGYEAVGKISQHPLTVEDEGNVPSWLAILKGDLSISPSSSLSLGPPSAGGGCSATLGRCLHTAANRERERERERNGVLFSPSRVDFLGSFPLRRRRPTERQTEGGVWWSLERTNDRTRHHVSAHVECRVAARKDQSDAALPCKKSCTKL